MASAIETISQKQFASSGHAGRMPGRSGFIRRVTIVVTAFSTWVAFLIERRRSRIALLEMTDDQLKDIGISRCDAHREGARPFWD